MHDCPNCGETFEDQQDFHFPWSDGITCSACGKTFDTDWDYVSEDSLAWWTRGEVKA